MSVGRTFEMLRCLAASGGPVTPTWLAERIDVPRASVYRLIVTLEGEGVLARSADRKTVQIAPEFLRSMLAGAAADQLAVGFDEVLSCTANTWGATAFLGRLNGRMIEVVRTATPGDAHQGFVHPGHSIRPAHACSAARAILAHLPTDVAAAIIGEDCPAFTEHTITDPDAIRRELVETRARGYAICDQEIDPGVTSVAAPVIFGRAGVLYSLGVVSFTRRIRELGIKAIGDHLRDSAGRAVANLGQNLPGNDTFMRTASRI